MKNNIQELITLQDENKEQFDQTVQVSVFLLELSKIIFFFFFFLKITNIAPITLLHYDFPFSFFYLFRNNINLQLYS